MVRETRGDPLAHPLLDEVVGLGDRGEVGLLRHHQVARSEALHRDGIGQVGELVYERDLRLHEISLAADGVAYRCP